MEIKIRNFKPSDYSSLVNLWSITGLGSPQRGDNLSIIEQSIEMGGQLFIMEYQNGIMIGTAWITFDGRRLHLHHFGIHPDHQRKGLGKNLTSHCLKFAKTKGYQIKLEVHNQNQAAIKLYRWAGFEYLGDYDVYIIRNLDQIEA